MCSVVDVEVHEILEHGSHLIASHEVVGVASLQVGLVVTHQLRELQETGNSASGKSLNNDWHFNIGE